MSKSALILGASGLVGGHCLRQLLADTNYDSVIIYVRKPLSIEHKKLIQVVINYEQLSHIDQQVDEIYCCLGTTIKKAGSKAAFQQVDFDYPLKIAQLAAKQGIGFFAVVSAIGANKSARLFYSQTKGAMETSISKLAIPAICIIRPSLISGERSEKRLAEDISKVFFKYCGFLFIGPLKKYRAVAASKIASALINAAQVNKQGVTIIESDSI